VDIDRATDSDLIGCLRVSDDRQEAADLAQEVFLRVHTRIDSFRKDCEFSTWLYTVVRSVAINRGMSRQRREAGRVDAAAIPEPIDSRPNPGRSAERNEAVRRLRRAVDDELEPLEARVIYLHHVDGLTLPAITRLLSLENKSGAKAFVVSGMRKLKRHFRAADGPRSMERS
jgi:RNA polymerase sigma-70 factor (ECF subfamily)